MKNWRKVSLKNTLVNRKGLIVMSLSAAFLLAMSSYPASEYPLVVAYSPVPEINLSTVRLIDCDEGYGSGSLIADDTIVTAAHVAEMTNCRDLQSGAQLTTYAVDAPHDLAMMTGKLPDMPYMRYSCIGFKVGQKYLVTGFSAHGALGMLFRQYEVLASPHLMGTTWKLGGEEYPNLRIMIGFSVPGTSGGAVIDKETNLQVGILNGGWGTRLGERINRTVVADLKDTILCKS
jgi:hypothetical protein